MTRDVAIDLATVIADAIDPNRMLGISWGSPDRSWTAAARGVLAYRREHWTAINDETWGAGNWVECGCLLDQSGFPNFHHKDFHGGADKEVPDEHN